MQYGKRALAHLRLELPLQVLMSNAAFISAPLMKKDQLRANRLNTTPPANLLNRH